MKILPWLYLPVILSALMGTGGYARGDNGGSAMAAGTQTTYRVFTPPAWSLKLPASIRFDLVLDDAAVLDKETGLVWEKSPDTTTRAWNYAVYYAYTKEVGGRKGWRLPTVEELASLVDTSVSGSPKLPSGHPFTNVQSGFYWSYTTSVGNPSGAWGVGFDSGNVYDNGKSYNYYVWRVRGGQGYDAP